VRGCTTERAQVSVEMLRSLYVTAVGRKQSAVHLVTDEWWQSYIYHFRSGTFLTLQPSNCQDMMYVCLSQVATDGNPVNVFN